MIILAITDGRMETRASVSHGILERFGWRKVHDSVSYSGPPRAGCTNSVRACALRLPARCGAPLSWIIRTAQFSLLCASDSVSIWRQGATSPNREAGGVLWRPREQCDGNAVTNAMADEQPCGIQLRRPPQVTSKMGQRRSCLARKAALRRWESLSPHCCYLPGRRGGNRSYLRWLAIFWQHARSEGSRWPYRKSSGGTAQLAFCTEPPRSSRGAGCAKVTAVVSSD